MDHVIHKVNLTAAQRSWLAQALLACSGLLYAATSWSHEDGELRERGHEVRSERRESRDERRMREQELRREREEIRAQQESAERERDALRDATATSDGSNVSGSNGSSSGASEDSDPRDDDGDHSGSDDSDRGSDDDDGNDDGDDGNDRARGSSTTFDVERDTQGHERVREEVLMVADADAISAVRIAGFPILSERPLAAFGEILARIRVRTGSSVEQVIQELQGLAPRASIAPHHLFHPSEIAAASSATDVGFQREVYATGAQVGIVDTGADSSWPVLANAIIRTHGFVDGGYVPRRHGTLVSEIVARSGARMLVGDVFGVDADNQLIAPGAAIASAIDWLVTSGVRVINISIEGPDNVVLAHVIRRTLMANVAIVAAAGNGGPAAAPAFPAAYPGIVAVTAVDENGQVYRRANRGDYISFAARGVHVDTEYESDPRKTVSGTSFAAPLVSAVIARRLDAGTANLDAVLAALREEARDLGEPGRDAVYGWGELVIPNALTANSHSALRYRRFRPERVVCGLFGPRRTLAHTSVEPSGVRLNWKADPGTCVP